MRLFNPPYGREATRGRFALVVVSSLLLAAFANHGCSAEGVDAPQTLGAYTTRPQDCPTAETLTADFHAARDAGQFDALAPLMERFLFDDGGIRVLTRLLMSVLRELGGKEVLRVFTGVEEGQGLARMEKHTKNVLDYVTGRGPLTAPDQHPLLVGPHYGPITATHRVLTRCDLNATLAVTRRILELEVEVVDEDGQVRTVPYIEPAFDALLAVAADPAFVALIEQLELEDEDEGGGIRVGRDAFILLVRLAVGNIAADNFDLAYLRGLIDDLLVSQLPEEQGARARLNHLLDVLEIVVNPESEIFPFVQAFMRCVSAQDEEGAVPGMLYDYLTVDTLDYTEFLADIDRLGDDPAGVPFREVSIAALATLEQSPALTRDGLQIAARFIAADVAEQTLPAAYDLVGTGVLTSGIDLLRAFAFDCRLSGEADGGTP